MKSNSDWSAEMISAVTQTSTIKAENSSLLEGSCIRSPSSTNYHPGRYGCQGRITFPDSPGRNNTMYSTNVAFTRRGFSVPSHGLHCSCAFKVPGKSVSTIEVICVDSGKWLDPAKDCTLHKCVSMTPTADIACWPVCFNGDNIGLYIDGTEIFVLQHWSFITKDYWASCNA
ncbi:hypothetical protein ElyMa_001523700 [Elysia marginata]|uniref:Sushi domain-containing protein n=1 Tax=Elysia marginata TaxID=1093978 RepID=A0AAV4JAH3_9GAST|nr:hypothetical protein ElyMa_001523700 [Elysia marginata]